MSSGCVIENETIPVLYEVPLSGKMPFSMSAVSWHRHSKPDLTSGIADKKASATIENVTIGIIESSKMHDAYLSCTEALRHAGYSHRQDQDKNGSTRKALMRKLQKKSCPWSRHNSAGGFGGPG